MTDSPRPLADVVANMIVWLTSPRGMLTLLLGEFVLAASFFLLASPEVPVRVLVVALVAWVFGPILFVAGLLLVAVVSHRLRSGPRE